MRRGAARHAAAQPQDPQWKEVELELDDAMATLPEPTRGVLVLRFFEGKTAREVGQQLGISEEAARKRVSRAVDELRELFVRRGVVLSAAGLAEGLATIALIKAPEGLAATAALAASTATTSAAAVTTTTTTSTAAITGGGILMASAKAKTAALVAAIVLLTGGAVTVGPKFFTPARQRTIKLADAGPSISGPVRGPDGQPVAGAEIIVGAPGQRGYAYDLGQRPRIDGVTDAAGVYSVARPPEPPYMIIVRAPNGYAEASWKLLGSDGTNVTLQPWGRIEGVAKQRGQVLPKSLVRLWRVQSGEDPGERLVHHETETRTDANGRFVFPRVAPGEAWVYREQHENQRGHAGGWTYLQIEPGRTMQVELGGVGRSAAGRVIVPPEVAAVVVWKEQGKYSYSADVRRDLPHIRATHAPDESPEQYRAVEEAFGRTPDGKTYKQWMFGTRFPVNPDGTFVIDDLPPGKYRINVRNFESMPEVNFMEDIAGGEVTFEVPPVSTSAPAAVASSLTTDPIDVGTITLKPRHRLLPGEAAPDINVTTIDGKPWRLADQKGKVVVLVCWGAYGDRTEMNGFTDLARRWGNDARVAILGTFVAPNNEQADDYIKRLKLHFPHTSDPSLMSKFDNSWPSAVIIGRDGKVFQKHLNNDTLAKYLALALGEAPPATAPGRRRVAAR
jgi:peroxiredoxin